MANRNRLRWLVAVAVLLCGVILLVLALLSRPALTKDARRYSRREVSRMERQLRAQAPTGLYILVDTAANRLWLKRGKTTLIEAKCSTGSGRTLECQGRRWTFETPRGEFRIQGKIDDPVWRKPDWAFLEEGKPVPTRDEDRYEENVLGEYALAIGNGYFIHGTLYNRMLGTNVTHGCIRLGSKDLVRLANTVPVGTKVYIF